MTSTPGAIERLSGGDLVELRSDIGPVPKNVGALLVLDDADADAVAQALRTRLAAIDRLRHRLVTPTRMRGRPYWADAPSFDIQDHLARVRCPAPADHDALLGVASEELTRPLPHDRPLWRAVVVDGLQDGAVGVVLVMHHVLTDGVGGLSMLAALADPDTLPASHRPAPPREPTPGPGSVPGATQPPAHRGGWFQRAAAALPAGLAQMRRGRLELGGRRRGAKAPRCSLNVPTGVRRRLATVDVDLDEVLTAARRRGATVNDMLLVAVTSAMDAVLRARGEEVAALVASVPVSARRPAAAGHTGAGGLGNQVGVMQVPVPVRGPLPERLADVAATTHARRFDDRGASAGLIGPLFRLLVAVGAFRWFINHQRLVNTFLTNVRGPADAVTLAGARVRHVAPLTSVPGNVAVSFAALSWAGRLVVTVVVDPDVADPEVLADATGETLRGLVRG